MILNDSPEIHEVYDDDILESFYKFNKAKSVDQNIPSPTDINHKKAVRLKLPILQFINYDKDPIKLQVSNTGRTAIVSGKWKKNEHPYIMGGPLNGKYVLSMILFHWGVKAKYGSFHTVQNIRRALEVQAIHFKVDYLKLEEAAKYDDGVVIISYIYEIRFQINVHLEPILVALDHIRKADCSICINTFQIKNLIPTFGNNFFTYNGKLILHNEMCFKNVIWIIPRQLSFVSFYQIKRFSHLLSKELLPIKRTLRLKPDTILKPTLFLVNPSKEQSIVTCLQMPFYKDMVNICDNIK